MAVPSGGRASNTRIGGIVAGVTLALTAVIVVAVPPLAESLTRPAATGAGARAVEFGGGGWVAGPPAAVAIARPEMTLPPPGELQPEDPVAARAQVEEALRTLFSGSNPREVRLSGLDDPSGVEEAMDAVRRNYPEASDTSTPELADLVFTDATSASFLFQLRYVGAPLLPARVGTARLVEGRWLITRATLCEVLSAAGAACGPVPPPPSPPPPA
jgi:hypothetical protein